MRKVLFMAFIGLMISGCGVKPNSVEPPQGKANDTFPRTYPSGEY